MIAPSACLQTLPHAPCSSLNRTGLTDLCVLGGFSTVRSPCYGHSAQATNDYAALLMNRQLSLNRSTDATTNSGTRGSCNSVVAHSVENNPWPWLKYWGKEAVFEACIGFTAAGKIAPGLNCRFCTNLVVIC